MRLASEIAGSSTAYRSGHAMIPEPAFMHDVFRSANASSGKILTAERGTWNERNNKLRDRLPGREFVEHKASLLNSIRPRPTQSNNIRELSRTDRGPKGDAPNAIVFGTRVNFRLDPHIALLVSILDNH